MASLRRKKPIHFRQLVRLDPEGPRYIALCASKLGVQLPGAMCVGSTAQVTCTACRAFLFNLELPLTGGSSPRPVGAASGRK